MGGLVDRYVARTTQVARRTCGVLPGERARARELRARAAALRRRRSAASGTSGAVDTFIIAICNGRYFGSGMHVAPMAKPDDGRFEVVSMDAPSKLAFASFSRRIYDASHLSTPGC